MKADQDLKEFNQNILRYNWESLVFVIAEDIEMNYLFLAEALKKTNVQLLWALNGQEAVDICLSDQHVDMLITDIQMPVKDGFVSTREIHEQKPDLPIIAYTAYSYEGVKEKMVLAGAKECLIKPFDARHMLTTIRKYLFQS